MTRRVTRNQLGAEGRPLLVVAEKHQGANPPPGATIKETTGEGGRAEVADGVEAAVVVEEEEEEDLDLVEDGTRGHPE